MPAQDPPSHSQPATPTRPERRTLRRLGWLAMSVLGALLLLVGITLIAVQTEWGARRLWQAAKTTAPGQLSGEVMGGTVRGGIHLRNVTYRTGNQLIFIDRLDAEWRLLRAPLRLHVRSVRANRIDVTVLAQPQAPSPPGLPQQLTLPMGLTLDSATVQQIDLHRDGALHRFGNMRMQGVSDGVRHQLKLLSAQTPYGMLQVEGRLQGIRPFSIEGSARLEGEIREEFFRAEARVSGTLQDLAVQLDVLGKTLNGQATFSATPFAVMPLRSAQVRVSHLDPQAFNADWPHADLTLNAALKPDASVRDLAQLQVEGPVTLSNALPGPIGNDLLPLVSAEARVSLSARSQQVSMLRVVLPGDASLIGNGSIQRPEQGDAQASYKLSGTLRNLNPALLYGTTRVRPATRTAGKARTGQAAAQPARPALAARINAEFDAQGMLKPEWIANLSFRIFDSMYANLPMSGSGNLRLAGKRVLPGSAQLQVAGNTLRVDGSFGGPGQTLTVGIDAPALGRLGFGLSGLLRVEAQITGSWDRAGINARIRAADLAVGNRGIDKLDGEVRATGVPRTGQINPDAPLRITLNASRLHSDGFPLDNINAAIEGAYGRYTLRALASGQVRGQPLALTLTAQGRLRGNAIVFDLDADASRLGVIDGQGPIALLNANGRFGITPGSPLSARIEANIPRLQTIGLLAGPRVELSGKVAAALLAEGTLAEPRLSGTLLGEGLGLTLYDQGIRLRDGSARMRLNDNILTIEHLNIRGGDGSLRASGSLPLFDARGPMRAVLIADNLQLLLSPSGRMTLSGEAAVTNPEGPLLLRGKFVVDDARFSLPERTAPRLDDDVVILRGTTTRTAGHPAILAEKPVSPFTPRIDIEVDLGKRFYFVGSGADLHLTGTVALRSEPGQVPRAFGTVRVVEGSYESFGTVLQIDRGLINFQGPPTNPNINILATRRQTGVTAGVQVSGTVRQPRVQLISDPDLPADERLSWLVFGRSSGAAGSGLAQAAAQEAALGLVNRLGGGRLAQTLGLDALTISQSEYGLNVGQVVNLGKEISDRLYLGYEQSLAGAESVVKLTYELTRYWSVVVRGGSITGLDVFYDRRFDGRPRN